MRLEAKSAVVVGAGQSPGQGIGIGRATAMRFAQEGARLLLVDREAVSLQETRSLIEAEGGRADSFVADTTSEADCAAMADAARDTIGPIDVLFNSVGIRGPGLVHDIAKDDWHRIIDVNLTSMWLTARAMLPVMMEQRCGSIVFVSSVGALRGASAITYGVSKAALNRLVIGLAGAYAEYDIRANAILPGLIDTPMAVDGALAQRELTRNAFVAQRASKVPMAYKGSAWDVANAALFFASEESRYVSGALLPVDGAYSAV